MARRIFALIALLVLGATAGWWLLRPISHRSPHRAVVTRTFAPSPPPETEAPVTQPPASQATETPPATAAPQASPSPPGEASPSASGPQLALIVDDCGQWPVTERGFLALDVPLTLSVLPGVRYTSEIAAQAQRAGKGVMLHLPMETLSGIYPGPGEITTEMSDAQIVAQTESDLAAVPLARGVNNHEGSKASADSRVMRDVIGVLAQHDLFFIDSRTNAASVGAATALALGVPTASRNVFLDNRADVAYSERQLLEAAAIAQRDGSAIAIGHPHATTLAAVSALIPKLQAEGIHFVLAADLATGKQR